MNPSYYVFARGRAIIVEGTESGRTTESLLRVFSTASDCSRYCENEKNPSIEKTTLLELWNILAGLNELSHKSYKMPLRVELSTYIDKSLRTVKTLHSSVDPQN